jgi:hypothetical protein
MSDFYEMLSVLSFSESNGKSRFLFPRMKTQMASLACRNSIMSEESYLNQK